MMVWSYPFILFGLALVGIAASEDVNDMSPFLRSMLGRKALSTGDIPAYTTNDAHVTRIHPLTKRDDENADTEYYMIETCDKMMNISLHPNRRLMSRNFVVQQKDANGDLQTMNSTKRNCFYTGKISGQAASRVAVSMCDGEMKGIVEDGDDVYVMEPSRRRGIFSHIAHKMKRLFLRFEDSDALPCPTVDELENGYTKFAGNQIFHICKHGYKLLGSRFRRCLPTGVWSGSDPICAKIRYFRRDEVQVLQCPELTAPEWGTVSIIQKFGVFQAVHKCLRGYRLNGNYLRFCKPDGSWTGSASSCMSKIMMDLYMNSSTADNSDPASKKKRQTPSNSIMEIMVYIDNGVVTNAQQNGFDVVDYILTIMNIMASLFREPSLGHQIDLTVTRVIQEGVNADFTIVQNAGPTLDAFCNYQRSINPASDANLLHHDHAIFITSVDICNNDGNGGCSTGVVGIAPINGMCSSQRSCTLNEDGGFGTAFVLAHETGHNLAMQHDGTGNTCGNSNRIMAPSTGGREENFLWSTCSAQYLQTFLNSGNSLCLNDVPVESDFPVNPTELPGLEYSADLQCIALHGPAAVACPFSFATQEICSRLWCQPTGSGSCFTRNIPPADGTSCESTNICVRGQCVDGSGTITPVDGEWSAFGPFSACSRTCGGGVRYRERQCNNPTPEFGGRFCVGDSREYDQQLCNTNECPTGSPSFRDQQCAATNDRPFNGVFYTWSDFTGAVNGVTECQLLCQTNGQNSYLVIREPVVQDGTPCNSPDSPDAICLQGTCTPIGCDNVINSEAETDACGVCNGNNFGATLNTFLGSGNFGYNTAGIVPSGARQVRISETTATSFIYLALESGGQAILNGGLRVRSSSSFDAAGNTFQYVRRSGEESVSTVGPLQEDLTVQALIAASSASYSLEVEYSTCD